MGPASAPIDAAASIGAAGSIGSTLIQGVINGRMNRKQRKWASKENQLNRDFSAEQAELARQWQEDFYNKYSSPEAIRLQYESAGMNPYLALDKSAGSVGSAPSASQGPSAAPSNSWNPIPLDLSGVSSAINSLFGNMKTAVETSLQEQFGSDLTKSEIFKNLGGNWAPLEEVYRKFQRDRAGDYAGLQDTTLRQTVQGQKIALENSLAQGALLSLDAKAKEIMNKYLPAQQQAEILATAARMFDMVQSGILKRHEAVKTISENLKIQAETQGIKMDNEVSAATADSLVAAMKAENEYNRRNFFLGVKQLPYDYGLHQQERYLRYQEMKWLKETQYNNGVKGFMDTYITPVTGSLGQLLGPAATLYLGSKLGKSPRMRKIGY